MAASLASCANAQNIPGDWMGTLDTGTVKLRVAFHITNTEDGLSATMDSLDQGAKGMRATAVSLHGASLKIQLDQIGGAFQGKNRQDLQTIDGTWAQRGTGFRLSLKRLMAAGDLERRRPQNPFKPYPYREEEVTYDSPGAGIQLAATLTAPPGM
jgi:hypothetical protein